MLLGSAGGIIFALCVAASCFGALNASTFTAARLVYVAGRESYLPSMFGELHPKRMTPVKALVLQGVLCSVMVIVGWSWYFVCSSEMGADAGDCIGRQNTESAGTKVGEVRVPGSQC